MRKVLTFILAGGRGERLYPLTRDRAKPAVPFGGIYRIIDFTLSNCVNSGLRRIYVLIQYKSFSLQKHILAGWDIVSTQLGEFIDVLPPQQRISEDWYKGTADAIYQNIYAIHDHKPEWVLILAGDHVYKMNYQKMMNTHRRHAADMTVACIPMPIDTADQFGVVEVNEHHHIIGFQEKPKQPRPIPGRDDAIFASMGIYLFDTSVLLEELEIDAGRKDSSHDFGKDIIPQMLARGKKIVVHDFVDERGRPLYWRDIGTRDAYYQANMDLVSDQPPFDLYDKEWPVRTHHEQHPPVKIVRGLSETGQWLTAEVSRCLIGGGCVIQGGRIEESVLGSEVRIAPRAHVRRAVLMEGVCVGEGASIQNAIIDKEVVIPAGARIGYDIEQERERFAVTTSGVVIVAKKTPL